MLYPLEITSDEVLELCPNASYNAIGIINTAGRHSCVNLVVQKSNPNPTRSEIVLIDSHGDKIYLLHSTVPTKWLVPVGNKSRSENRRNP